MIKTRFFSIQHFFQFYPQACVFDWAGTVCDAGVFAPGLYFKHFVSFVCVIYGDNYSISSLRINLSIISPVLTFQQLFEEEGVPITAEEVALDTNFKLKKNSMILWWFHRIELFPTSG